MFFWSKKEQKKKISSEKRLILGISEIDFDSIHLVGEKALSVAQLAAAEVPVPPGFVVTTDFFDNFMEEASIRDVIKRELDKLKINKYSPTQIRRFSQVVQGKISSAKFSEGLLAELKKSYTRLGGFSETWVAVRSSIMSNVAHHASFVGQLNTELNIRGLDDLEGSVKRCFASLFSLSCMEYAFEHDLDPTKLQIAVLVQKMVQSETSGTVFTLDPVTNDESLMTIEAVYGLGDVISSGELTPDLYTVSKDKLRIRDRRIVPQEWMNILKMGGREVQTTKLKISPAWQTKQKLEDDEIVRLAEIAKFVEGFFKRPQNIEWVMENGNFWIVQSRPAVNIDVEMIERMQPGYSKTEHKLISDIEKASKEFVNSPKELASDITSATTTFTLGVDKTVSKLKPTKKLYLKRHEQGPLRIHVENKLNMILSGVSAGNGIVCGPTRVVLYEEDLKDVQLNEVLVLKGDNARWISSVPRVRAIITDIGGVTSDLAIIARQRMIPCVVDTQIGTKLFRQGEILTVDSSTGKIYEGSLPNFEALAKHSSVRSATKAKIQKSKSETTKRLSVSSVKSKNKKKSSVKKSSTSKKVARKKQKPPVRNIADPAEDTLTKSVKIDGKEVKIQDVKILTATKTLLDFSTEDQFRSIKDQPYSIADGVGFLSGAVLSKLIGKHPYAFVEDKSVQKYVENAEEILEYLAQVSNPNPVIYHLNDLSAAELKKLSRGKTMEKLLEEKLPFPEAVGVERYLAVPKLLKMELEAVKKLRNKKGFKNLSIAVSDVKTAEQLREIKTAIASNGLRRSKTFNIFLVPTVPANLFEIEKLLDIGIDGVVVDPEVVVSVIVGHPMSAKDFSMKKYLANESVMNALQDLFKAVTKEKKKAYVLIRSVNKDFVTKLIEWGVDVIIKGKSMSKAQRTIRDLENSLILKRGRK